MEEFYKNMENMSLRELGNVIHDDDSKIKHSYNLDSLYEILCKHPKNDDYLVSKAIGHILEADVALKEAAECLKKAVMFEENKHKIPELQSAILAGQRVERTKNGELDVYRFESGADATTNNDMNVIIISYKATYIFMRPEPERRPNHYEISLWGIPYVLNVSYGSGEVAGFLLYEDVETMYPEAQDV